MHRTGVVSPSSIKLGRFCSGMTVACTMLFSINAASAPAPNPPATSAPERKPIVVAPRLVEQAPVPYPQGAEGDAIVIVVLTVNADGTVRSARAQEGDPPFANVAVESVKQWSFEPATRDGVAVAATIRMEVAFHAPVVKEVEEPPPSLADAAPPPTPASEKPQVRKTKAPPLPQQPIEVTVVGDKRAPMVVSLARTEVRQIPGTFGDPFRALEILPGVTPIISGLPYFYVRGAPPGNVGYYLDGIRVPYLYHVAIGPSVIHPGMVDRVDLYRGGYPARFGRYAGGIAAAETTAPNATPRGEANIRLFDAGAMVESGFAGGRGTVLLGGRYSYTAAIISLIAKGIKLDYRDYQARVTYDVTPKDQVSLVAFGAYDLLAQEQNGISTIGFGTEFYRGELRWDRQLPDDGRVRTAVTLGYDQTAMGGQRNAQDRMIGVRSEVEKQLSGSVRLRTGVDSLLDSYRITTPLYDDPDNPNSKLFNSLFPPRKDAVVGTHAELGIEVQKGFFVTPGLRLDYYMSGGATAVGVDPRLSSRIKLSDSFAIIHAYGIAHQPPSFVLPIPGLALGSLSKGLQTAYQTSAGIDWSFAKATSLEATVFYNLFTNLTDVLSVPEGRRDSFNQRTKGNAYGLELFLHRKLTQDLGGILSYTLSRSLRYLNGAEFPSAFDRRHVFNGALAYNLGRRWRAGSRLVFYTGAPKRTTTTTTSTNSEAPTAGVPPTPMVYNPPRDPAFYRIDLRLEKLWPIGKTGHISFVAEMMNVTMKKEIFNGAAIGPISVPSIGVEGGF
jgi:TonB family protein